MENEMKFKQLKILATLRFALRKVLILFFFFMSFVVSAQKLVPDWDFTLKFIDANGNQDSVVFGYHNLATVHIDSTFGELDIKSIPFPAPFSARISNNAYYTNIQSPNDSAQYYTNVPEYLTKLQIYNYDSTNGMTFPIFAINFKCNYFPITVKWNKLTFSKHCIYNTLITNWNPRSWFDALNSPYEQPPTFLRNKDSVVFSILPSCHINSDNDTLHMLFFALIPFEWMNSISEKNSTKNVARVFPSVSTGKFNISTDALPINVSVYNVLGERVLLIDSFNKNSIIDLSANKNGIYFINIQAENTFQSFKILLNK